MFALLVKERVGKVATSLIIRFMSRKFDNFVETTPLVSGVIYALTVFPEVDIKIQPVRVKITSTRETVVEILEIRSAWPNEFSFGNGRKKFASNSLEEQT